MVIKSFKRNSISGWFGWWNKYCRKFCASGYHSSRLGSWISGKVI